jgi:hypothetical protein
VLKKDGRGVDGIQVGPDLSPPQESAMSSALVVQDVDELLAEAARLSAEGERRGAREALLQATCVAPDDARPLTELGHLLRRSEPEQAERWFRRALDKDPLADEPLASLAELLLSSGRAHRARWLLEESVLSGGPGKEWSASLREILARTGLELDGDGLGASLRRGMDRLLRLYEGDLETMLSLRASYPDLFPEPVRPVRDLKGGDLDLLAGYLRDQAIEAGEDGSVSAGAWDELDPPKESWWDEVERHLTSGQTVLEIGPGAGAYTDRYLGSCRRAWLVDESELVVHQLLPHRLAGNERARAELVRDCRFEAVPDASVDLLFSLGASAEFEAERFFGYLREARRVIKQDGRVVLHHRSFVGDEAWALFEQHVTDDCRTGAHHFLHPTVVEELARRAGFDIVDHVIEKDGADCFVHLEPRER